MPGRIEVDPERGFFRSGPGRSEREHRLLPDVEVIDLDVEMQLLRNYLCRPLRRVVVLDFLERDDRPGVVRTDKVDLAVVVSGELSHPQDLTVEIREKIRVGAVDNDHVQCANHASTVGEEDGGRYP